MANNYLLHYFSKRLGFFSVEFFLACILMCLLAPSTFAQNAGLTTSTEKMVGLTFSSYKYEEPSYMMLKANKVGIDISGVYELGSRWPNPRQGWFVKGEFQTLSGKADYQSPLSGAISNTPNRSLEVRALVGKDFEVAGVIFAPYVGLGYRYLYSNIGYERTSIYNTLPIGMTHKMSTSGLAQLHTSVEYMHLLGGEHKVNLLSQNVRLDQRRGYGLRLSVMHRQEAWSMGPTLTFWSMPQSELAGFLPVYEPLNKTLELGFKGSYRF